MNRSSLRVARVAAAGALATGLLVFPLVAPASAHDKADGHGTIAVTPTGDLSAVPTVSGTFKGTVLLGIPAENINAVTLTLSPTGPTAGDAVTVNGCDFATDGGCGTASVSYSWTPPTPAFNGPYEANATAEHCTIVCVSKSTARVTPAGFRLAVAPKAPSDIQAANGADRSVNVSWARNAEPDMLYYAVFRKLPGAADFTRIGGDIRQPTSGRVSFADTSTGDGGDIAYKVVAVRKGLSGDNTTTKASAPSVERSVKVDPPPPPTTAAPTVPNGPGAPSQPPQAVPAGAGVSISGFLSNAPTAKAPPGPKYLDLPDTGFGQTLPFETPPTDELEDGEAEAVEPGASSVDSGSEQVSLTRPLVPVAAGAILLVLAGHVRLLNRRVKQSPPLTLSDGTVFGGGPARKEKPAKPRKVAKEAKRAQRALHPPVPGASPGPDELQATGTEAATSPESSWVEFEPPAVSDSDAGGRSLPADPIGYYIQAAVPYYEDSPSSTDAINGNGTHTDDTNYADDAGQPDAPEPVPASAYRRESRPQEPVITATWRNERDDIVPMFDDITAAEATGGDDRDEGNDRTGGEAWEEEMIWEVVSPTR